MQGSSKQSPLPQADLSKIREPKPRRPEPLDIDALWNAAPEPEPIDVDELWKAAPAPKPGFGDRLKGAALGAMFGPPGMAAGFTAGSMRTKAAIGSAARQFTGALGGPIEGLGVAEHAGESIRAGWEGEPQPEPNALMRVGGAISDLGGNVFPEAVRQSEETPGPGRFLAGPGAGAIGSAAGFAVPGLGLAGAGLKLGRVALSALAATQGALQSGAARYYDAVGHGADEDTAGLAFLGGLVEGSTEAFSPLPKVLHRAISRMPSKLKQAVWRALREGAEEGLQETTQQAIGNQIAQYLYDEDRKILEGVAEGGGAGVLAGVVMSALGAGAGGGIQPTRLEGRRPTEQGVPKGRPPLSGVMDVGGQPQAQVPLIPPMPEEFQRGLPPTQGTTLVPQAAIAPEEPAPIAEGAVPARGSEGGPTTPTTGLLPEAGATAAHQPSQPTAPAGVAPEADVEAGPGVEQETLPTPEEVEPPAEPDRPERVLVRDIAVDPQRFQFKGKTDARTGVKESDIGEAAFDPRFADNVLVWEDKSGQRWIVDGHHRLERARRSDVSTMNAWVLRESAGTSERTARGIGAARNMAAGRGSATDAAKLMRELGWSEEQLQGLKVNTKSGLGKNAVGLSKLSDVVFSMVVNEELPENFGAVIGRELDDPGLQMEAANDVRDMRNEDEAAALVRQIKSGPAIETTQTSMFGDETSARSLRRERAKVEVALRRKLKSERSLFNMLAQKAGTAQRVEGNKIAAEASKDEAKQLDDLLDTITRLANYKGPVSDILNDAAHKLALGESQATVSEEALKRLAEIDWKAAADSEQGASVPPARERPSESLFSSEIDKGWDEIGKMSGRARAGIDVDLLAAMAKQAGRYIKRGAQAFSSFVKDATAKLGAKARPYLRKAWKKAGGGAAIPAASGKRDFTLPDETWLQARQRQIENYFNRPAQAQKLSGVRDENADVELAEDEFSGRVKERLDRHRREYDNGQRDNLRKYGIKLDEADEYVVALHTPARRKIAEQRHPKLAAADPAFGSGMTLDEAAAIVKKYEGDPRAEGFKEIAALNRKMVARSRRLLVTSGVLTRDEALAWERDFGPDYVPLKDQPDEHDEREFRGTSGFSVRGPESKRAEGRSSRASGVLVRSIADAESAIIRAEKNRVGAHVGELVKQVPNAKNAAGEKLFEFAYGVRETTEGNQPVARRAPPPLKKGEHLFSYKEKGHPVHILVRDDKYARALDRMGIDDVPGFARLSARIVSILRQLSTVWSPDYLIGNIERDVGTAAINVQEFGKGWARAVFKGIPGAVRGAFRVLRDEKAQGKWEKLYREFAADGGPTGFFDYKSLEDRRNEIGSALKRGRLLDAFHALKDFVEDAQKAVEVGTRLSAYAVARERGMTHRRAAQLARHLTTPFHRYGEWGPTIGSLYMFGKANISGPMRTLRALKHPRVQAAAGAVTIMGFVSAMLRYALSGDDDDGRPNADKVPTHEFYDSIAIPVPGSTKALRWRMPYGYRVFHQLGAAIFLMMAGRVTPGQAGSDLAFETFDSFNPLGRSGSALELISPTVTDPLAEVAVNKTWFGGTLYPDYPNDQRPDSEQKLGDESKAAQAVSRWLNNITGGDEVEEGAVSVHPSVLDMWAGFLGGGAGKTMMRATDSLAKAARGEKVELGDVPVVRALMSDRSPHYEVSTFSRTKRRIDEVYRLIQEHEKAATDYPKGSDDRVSHERKAAELRSENRELLRLRIKAGFVQKDIREWGKEADALEDGSQKRRDLEQKALDRQRRFNVAAYKAGIK